MHDPMRLRTLAITSCAVILAVAGLTAPPLTYAQEPGKIYRIGWLGPEATSHDFINTFLEALRSYGWVEGENVEMEIRLIPKGQIRQQSPALAVELVRRNVDLMVTVMNVATLAAKAATETIPIVMAGSVRPIQRGLIKSLSRPRGNITGMTIAPGPGYSLKTFQLLQEAVPGISRIGILRNPLTLKGTDREAGRGVKVWQADAKQVGLTATVVVVKDRREYQEAFARFTRERVDALHVTQSTLNVANAKLITDFARRQRLPISTTSITIVRRGGLLRYFIEPLEPSRHAAFYADKILKGARPADLPVERPRKFRFIVNLKTAKALGIVIPPTLLSQADEVIQ